MVKIFNYRGKELEQLQSMPNEDVFELLNSRQRRSLKRGITDGKRKLIKDIKALKSGETKNQIKTHLRDLIILPHMVGVDVNVFSGKEFKTVSITPPMIGHYIGEYVITNKKVSHGAPGVGASRSSLYVPLK
ncbi:MAG: ribosomal protein S19 [Cenarchaeum symbiont of Oopsacas minuta]|nr:ribosomal protein S19 [Cenarchaeum symbiont of Oopsacas minuta]